MPGTLARSAIVGVPVGAVLVLALVRWIRTRSLAALLLTIGAAFLVVTVLTHVAEASRWLPAMRWGQPDSVGHYLDLASAALGLSCLAAGTVIGIWRWRKTIWK